MYGSILPLVDLVLLSASLLRSSFFFLSVFPMVETLHICFLIVATKLCFLAHHLKHDTYDKKSIFK